MSGLRVMKSKLSVGAMQFRYRYLLVGICPVVVWIGTIIVVRFVTGLAWLDGLWTGAALVSIVWVWVMPRVLGAWQDSDEKQGRDVTEAALLASLAVARLHDDDGTDWTDTDRKDEDL